MNPGENAIIPVKETADLKIAFGLVLSATLEGSLTSRKSFPRWVRTLPAREYTKSR